MNHEDTKARRMKKTQNTRQRLIRNPSCLRAFVVENRLGPIAPYPMNSNWLMPLKTW